ncbi:MAG: FG-GAP repeat protein, partial [Candidatus Magasanikbacteria bacterium]|nr:FG-GAP repeat protein [Candidatus Magasanikbacteria bacterium]
MSSKHLILALIPLAVAVTFVFAAESTIQVGNVAPVFEDATGFEVQPSDNGSSVGNPTTIGGIVTFTVTATDPNGDAYYAAICKTDSVTARDGDTPVCDDGAWAQSTLPVASGSSETLAYTSAVSDKGVNEWHAFVCDALSKGSQCSDASQGGGDNGSPFVLAKKVGTLRFGADCPDLTELRSMNADERANLQKTLTAQQVDAEVEKEMAQLGSEEEGGGKKVILGAGLTAKEIKAIKDDRKVKFLEKRSKLQKLEKTNTGFCVVPSTDDTTQNVLGKSDIRTQQKLDYKVDKKELKLDFKTDPERSIQIQFLQSKADKQPVLKADKTAAATATGPTIQYKDKKSANKLLTTSELEKSRMEPVTFLPKAVGGPKIEYKDQAAPVKLVSGADIENSKRDAYNADLAAQPSFTAQATPAPVTPKDETAPVAPVAPAEPVLPSRDVYRTVVLRHQTSVAPTGAIDQLVQGLFGGSATPQEGENEFKMEVAQKPSVIPAGVNVDEETVVYKNLNNRKQDIYKYINDPTSVASNQIKNYTVYNSGKGTEEELYTVDNAVLHKTANGTIEGYYFDGIDLSGQDGAKGADPDLLARASRALAKERMDDLYNNGGPNPDFVIPAPFALDKDNNVVDTVTTEITGEKHNQLTVSFTAAKDAYPLVLDPTMVFTAPGLAGVDATITGNAAGDYFPSAIAISDMNNDGVADLIVGAGYAGSSDGRVYVFYSDGNYPATSASYDLLISGEAGAGQFGVALAVGDLNYDGKPDLAVGANAKISNAGKVYLFYNDGSVPTTAATADVAITGDTSSSFGSALAIGDLNSNSRADLVVGGPYYSTSTGRAYIYWNDGAYPTTAATADVIIVGQKTYSNFGFHIAIGNLDSDTDNDLAISADDYDPSATAHNGRVYLFYQDGTTWGTSACTTTCTAAAADTIISGSAGMSGYFGYSLEIVDLNADGLTDLVASAYWDSAGHVYAFWNDGAYPATSASADLTINGESSGNGFGAALATGDLNADGIPDLIVGAYGYNSSQGRTYVFYNDGSITTVAGNADLKLTGEATGNQYGVAFATGDLNNDGSADLAVGASTYSTNYGRTYVYFGEGTERVSDSIFGDSTVGFSWTMATGDLNSDGKTDLVVGSYSSNGKVFIFYNDGSYPTHSYNADVIITGQGGVDNFGYTLAVGDLNNDGRADLTVGSYAYSSFKGRAYIFYNDGLSFGTTYCTTDCLAVNADSILEGQSASDYFGYSLSIGDLNSDSRADLVVGAMGYSSGNSSGRAYIFLQDSTYSGWGSSACAGTDGSPCLAANGDYIITGESTSHNLSRGMAIGDMNNDGKKDLVLGADGYMSTQGRVYIFYQDATLWGTSSCTTACAASAADVIITGETAIYASFGIQIALADMDANGTTDLVVSASSYSSNTGKVYIFYNDGTVNFGSATCSGTPALCSADNADVKIAGESTSQFGSALNVNDFNNDGRTDLAIGGNRYNSYQGRSYIFYNDGSIGTVSCTTGCLASNADVIITGEQVGDYFGNALTSGDLNADGTADLVAGTYATSKNKAYIFYGEGGIETKLANIITGSVSSASFATSAAAGDFNSDGRADIAIVSNDYVYVFFNDGAVWPSTDAGADVKINVSSIYGRIAVGDLNADDRTDILVSAYSYNGNQGAAWGFFNNGDGTFGSSACSTGCTTSNANLIITGDGATLYFGTAITVGDVNADRRQDIIVGANGGNGKAYIFYNNGTGTIGSPTCTTACAAATNANVTIAGDATNTSFGNPMTTGDLNADGKADLAVGGNYSSGTGRVFIFINDGSIPTTAATADYIISGEAASDGFGYNHQGLAIGDLNSDGRSDLVVGAPIHSSNAGRLYIFWSDSTLFGTTACTTGCLASNADAIIDGQAGSELGRTIAIGDLNADNRNDLVNYAQAYGSYAGRAYVFYNEGTFPTSAANADVILTGEATNNYFGIGLAIGDFNTDGVDDLAIGAQQHSSWLGRAYLYYGQREYGWNTVYPYPPDLTRSIYMNQPGHRFEMQGAQTSEQFGKSFATGDFNGDGTRDLAVGAPAYSSNQGRVYIFLNKGVMPGTDALADVVITGTGSYEFGYSLAAGQLSETRDAIDDLVIGAPGYGAVYMFNGRSTWNSTYTYSNFNESMSYSTGARCGNSVAVGNFYPSSDARLDIVYGCSTYGGTGYVFWINNDGTYPAPGGWDSYAAGTGGTNFGTIIVAADINFDGKTDTIVGDPGFTSSQGRVQIFYNDGNTTADVTITGNATGDQFGATLAVGELSPTRDNRVDLAVGAPGYNTSNGRVYLFYNDGAIPTTAATADVTITGNYSGAFGRGLATGDYNHDGRTDLASGSPNENTNQGVIRIFYNDGSWPTSENSADELFDGKAASSYDAYTLGFADITEDGWDDLLVGGYGYNSSQGHLMLYDGMGAQISGSGNSVFGSAFAIADFDGNGKKDLAIGDPTYNSSQGRVYIFLDDLSTHRVDAATKADVIITGGATGDKFGTSLAAGKVSETSDLIDDLVVGAPGARTNGGYVYLFNGTTAWSATLSAGTSGAGGYAKRLYESAGSCGTTVFVGNLLGDSREDFGFSCVSSWLDVCTNDGSYPNETYCNYYFSQSGNRFSSAVGDFNNDGRLDLALGDPSVTTNTGAAYIYTSSGTALSLATTITGNASGDKFGYTLAAGDLNADGTTDLVVGAPEYTTNYGRAYLYNNDGSWPTTAATADTNFTGASGDKFGYALAANDFNNDGRADLLVGAPGYNTNIGRVLAFYNDGSYPTTAATADGIFPTANYTMYTGSALALGDLNSDGQNDLVCGNPGSGSGVGYVSIIFGQRSATMNLGTVTITDTSGFTNDTTPVITMGSVTGGPATHVQFSCDGETWGSFVAYPTSDNAVNDGSPSSNDFDMITGGGCASGDGAKTVYARLYNSNNGEYSNWVTDSTNYDSTGPTTSMLSISNPATPTYMDVSANTATDGSGSGAPYQYRFSGQACTGSAAEQTWGSNDVTTKTVTGLSANTQYAFKVQARDELLNIGSYSACGTATYTSANAPTTPGHTLTSPTQMHWSWVSGGAQTDYAYGTTSSCLTAASSAAYWDESGLTANTQYTRYACARNGDLDKTSALTIGPFYTAANTPGLPSCDASFATGTSVRFTVPSGGTQKDMAIYVATGSGSNCNGSSGLGYVQYATGTIGGSADYQVVANWANKTLTGLSGDTQYFFCGVARNGDNEITPFGSANGGATCYTNPILNSIVISDNNSPSCSGYGCTNSATPSITLSYSGGAPYSMAFSCDGVNYGMSYSFNTPTSIFNMTNGATNCNSTNGLKTITAQVIGHGIITQTATASDTTYYDTGAPTISSTAPATSAFINTQSASYTYSEAMGSGTITWTRTSGSTDNNSPHPCTLSGSNLTSGAHTGLAMTAGNCGGTWNALVDGTVYSVAFAGADLATNSASTVTNTSVTYDTTPPAVTSITSVAGDASAPYYDSTNDSSTAVVYTASADAVTCKWDTSDLAFASMANTCASTTNCTLNLSGEGAKTVYMRCMDNASNASTSSYTLSYTIDITPPAVTSITSVAGDSSAPYYDTTNDSSTLVVYTASADATACKWNATDVAYDSMASTCSSTTNCTLNLSGEGAKTVYMRCVDNAGNKSTSSYTLNYTIDATPPAVTGITSVAGDTTTPFFDTTDDASTLVVYTASADAATCKWDTSDVAYASMANTCSSTTNCTMTLTGEGAKFTYMRCIDSAGLTSTSSFNLNYTIDTIPPAVTSITSVASDPGAPYYDTTDDSSTAVNYVTTALATFCKWDTSDVAYASMANTCASTTWCTFNLSGQGAKTVYMRCLEESGLTSTSSYPVNYTIDSVAPTITSTAPASSTYLTAQQVSFTFSEAVSYGTIQFTRTGGTADGNSHFCSLQGTALNSGAHTNLTLATGANACTNWQYALVDGAIYTVTFDAGDVANNPATTVTNTSVTYDITPPAVTSITSVAGDSSAPYYDTTNDSSTAVVYTASA